MTNSTGISPLRQRMINDMVARGLVPQTQKGHVRACKRFAAYLKRSPELATADDVRLFQLHLIESGLTIQNRNRTMTGVRFLLKVTMRRHDLAAEIFHIKEPTRIPQILSADEARRLLMMAATQPRVLLSIGYGAGLRVSEVVRLKVRHIDAALGVIRVEQSKGKKDRHVMLSPETHELLKEWWKVRTNKYDLGVEAGERWLFPGRRKGLHLTPRQVTRLYVPRVRRGGRIEEEAHAAYPAALVRDASLRSRGRYQNDPGVAWAREVGDDGALHACRNGPDHGGREPARSTFDAAPESQQESQAPH